MKNKLSAEKRSFGRRDIRWMPTIAGKIMASGGFPFGGYATRREAVAAAKHYQEFGTTVPDTAAIPRTELEKM
jgi:hypothetical protein